MINLPTLKELGGSCVLLNPCPNAQELIFYAMHQCYSEKSVAEEIFTGKFDGWSQSKFGESVVNNLLKGNKGHFGPLEEGHQFMFAVGGTPHSLITHLRTHRTGVTFDVTSGRFTGLRFVAASGREMSIEEVFYFRPVGREYTNRQGKRYIYTQAMKDEDIQHCLEGCKLYAKRIEAGVSEEHARSFIAYDFRQPFVFSANIRALLHLDAMRNKADAQLEIQVLMQHINVIMQGQAPEIYGWWNTKSKRMLSA